MTSTPNEQHIEKICQSCYLYDCVCEQDRLDKLQDDKDEIKMYHSAKVGSRLYRKMNECPCDIHSGKRK